MRQVAAAALTKLYEPDNVSPLSIFTDRFKTRFAELIYDVDELVAVQGVGANLSTWHRLKLLSSHGWRRVLHHFIIKSNKDYKIPIGC